MLDHHRLRELRELAQITIAEAAGVVHTSYTTLCNFELGHGKLTDRQIEILEAFYAPKVSERLAKLERLTRVQHP